MNRTEIVTIYYISCRFCQQEAEISRRPPNKNVATGFGSAWNVDVVCPACDTKAHYGYDDVRKRHEPAVQTLEEAFSRSRPGQES